MLREEAGRGGSAYVHDTLRPGQLVEVAGPRNHFRLEPAASYVFVAGGIGITPILPMLAAATAAGADWTLLYGGRTASSMAFTAELARYGDRVTLWPQDSQRPARPRRPPRHARARTRSSTAAARSRCSTPSSSGWPAGRPASLHLERFAAPVVERDPAAEHAVEVVLAESGRTLLVPPDRSVLEVLLEEGVDVLHDCQEGICGTCEVKVIEGEVDHRDFVLSEPEKAANSCMMVCVSRACGKRWCSGSDRRAWRACPST